MNEIEKALKQLKEAIKETIKETDLYNSFEYIADYILNQLTKLFFN